MPEIFKPHFNDVGCFVLYAQSGELAQSFDPSPEGREKALAFIASANNPTETLSAQEAAFLASRRNPTDKDPEYAALKRKDPEFSHLLGPQEELPDWEFEEEWEFDPDE